MRESLAEDHKIEEVDNAAAVVEAVGSVDGRSPAKASAMTINEEEDDLLPNEDESPGSKSKLLLKREQSSVKCGVDREDDEK